MFPFQLGGRSEAPQGGAGKVPYLPRLAQSSVEGLSVSEFPADEVRISRAHRHKSMYATRRW